MIEDADSQSAQGAANRAKGMLHQAVDRGNLLRDSQRDILLACKLADHFGNARDHVRVLMGVEVSGLNAHLQSAVPLGGEFRTNLVLRGTLVLAANLAPEAEEGILELSVSIDEEWNLAGRKDRLATGQAEVKADLKRGCMA